MSASSSSRITPSNTTRMPALASSPRYSWNVSGSGRGGAVCSDVDPATRYTERLSLRLPWKPHRKQTQANLLSFALCLLPQHGLWKQLTSRHQERGWFTLKVLPEKRGDIATHNMIRLRLI